MTDLNLSSVWENKLFRKTFKPNTDILHSYNDQPAFIEFWKEPGGKQGCPKTMRWHDNGLYADRGALPNVILFDLNGKISQMSWVDRNGVLSREGKPARFVFGKHETVQMWYKDGFLHRIGKPAVISSQFNEKWFYHGKNSRIDGGPAVTQKVQIGNKQVIEQQWRIDDVLHRLDKPAVVRSNGDEEYWVAGQPVNEVQHLAISAMIDTRNPVAEVEQVLSLNLELLTDTNHRHRGVVF